MASVRGSGAAASAGLESSGAMSCGSSEGAVSGVSGATGGCDSAGCGEDVPRAVVESANARRQRRKKEEAKASWDKKTKASCVVSTGVSSGLPVVQALHTTTLRYSP